ncbi:MAG: lipopolysaccharide kinase InaA family protein [Pseudohongiellaceae bacterium]
MRGLSSKELAQLGREAKAPFKIGMATDEGVKNLVVTKILRLLPGKRLTAVAQYQGSTVVAKLFFHPQSWQRHRDKERQGIKVIKKHKLLAPEIVAEYQLEQVGAVILLEYLEAANSLAEHFLIENQDDTNDPSKANLDKVLSSAFELLCLCHNCGLWQRDMHLGNYLLCEERLYLIDGADIQLHSEAANKTERLESIAEFASQFPVYWDRKLETMLNSYGEHYRALSQDELATIRCLVNQIRRKRLAHIEKKVFKTTSANRKIQRIDCLYVHDRRLSVSQVEEFTQSPSSSFDKSPLLKNGDTTTVGQAVFANLSTVVKRYNVISFGKWLSHLPVPSRAQKCWKNAHMLLLLGLRTPRPLMFYEERKFWLFRYRAYFLNEKLPASNLLDQLNDENEFINKPELVTAFETFFQAMKDYQISHGDMKATNFVFYNSSLYILDLDGMKRHKFKWVARRKGMNDVRRFEKNWRDSPHEALFAPLIDKLYQERQVPRHD